MAIPLALSAFLPIETKTSDPAGLWQSRIRYDRVLFLAVLVIMLDRYTFNPTHETLGVISIAALGLHAWVNRAWYTGVVKQFTGRSKVRRRKPGLGRYVTIALNALLTLSFIASIVSGLMASQTLLAWATPDAWRMDLEYRTAHVALSVWAWLFAGLHAGAHWEALFPAAAASRTGRIVMAGLGIASLAALPFAWLRRETDLLLGFGSAYIPVELEEIPGLMAVDLVIVFLGFAAAAAFVRIGWSVVGKLVKSRK